MPNTFKGDIKTLYTFYRLSDYEMTNIALTDKVLEAGTGPLHFEGHMTWSFNKCIFQDVFVYGIAGPRLDGDKRGEEGFDPYPPYGSNGIVFDGCTFDKEFEIWDNCVVVFKSCVFNNTEPVKIGQNTRVEYIDCEFHGPVEFTYFCEIRMRDCKFSGMPYAIKATAGCKFFIDETTAEGIDEYFISVEDDCQVDVSSKEATSYTTTSGPVFKGTDHSSIRLYGLGTVESQIGPALEVSDSSKIEVRKTTEIKSPQGDAVSISEESEGYFNSLQLVESTQSNAFLLDKSVLRIKDVAQVLSTQQSAINATDSKIYGLTVIEFSSSEGVAIKGVRSSFDLAEGEQISSTGEEAVNLTGESKSVFRDFTKVEGKTTGASINDSAQAFFQRVQDAVRGLEEAGCEVDGGILRVADCNLIEGLTSGVIASNSARVQTRSVKKILGIQEVGLLMEDSAYDIHTATEGIFGVDAAVYLGNCQGVITDVEAIVGEDLAGIIVNETSGPSEFSRIKLIQAPSDVAAYFSVGENSQIQVTEVDEITSEQGDAVRVYVGEGSTLDFYDVTKITAVEQAAIRGDIAGRFTLAKSEAITSQTNQIVVLTAQGINSYVRFADVDSMTTDESEESPVFVSGANTIELEGIGEITVTKTEASVVELQGRGVEYGSIKVLDCPKIEADECSNGLFTHNALITDIVGTNEECEILCNITKFAALSVKDTNLYLSNYNKIEAQSEGHAIDLEVINARGVEMKIYTVRQIIGGKDGIHYEGRGSLKLVDLPQIAGKAAEDHSLFILGTDFVTFEAHNSHTVSGRGKVNFVNGHGAFYKCSLKGDVNQAGARLDFFNTPITLDAAFDTDVASSTYFFHSDVTNGKVTSAGVITSDLSSFPQGDIQGAGIFNKSVFTDYWHLDTGAAAIFNAHETAHILHVQGGVGTAALLNGYKGTGADGLEISDGAGVIANSIELADGNITINNNCGFIGNRIVGLATKILTQANAGSILNQIEVEELELDSYAASIANYLILTGQITLGGADGLLLNRAECTDIVSQYGGNALLFNWLSAGDISTSTDASLVGSGIAATGLTLGTGSGVSIAGGSIGSAPVVPNAASFLSAGADLGGDPTGQGNALVLTSGNTVNPANAGIVIRGSGTLAEVYIKTPKTSILLGDGGTNSDLLIRATSGLAKLLAKNIERIASADIFDEATGDIIRNATGDIVDIATDLDRQGSGTITDTATAIVHVPPV